MRKRISTFVMTITFLAGAIFMGCESSDQKIESAQDQVQDAKQNLQTVQNDANLEAQRVANAEEWAAFKNESELIIKNNEVRIAELKRKIKGSRKTLDALYTRKVDTLEQRNRDMEAKIGNYEKNKNDWESFKREFNHDMDKFGEALKDLTVDNKR